MGLKTLIRLLGVLVISAVVFGIVKCASRGSGVTTVKSSEEKRKIFPEFKINDVSKIRLSDKENTLTINRGNEFWEVAERAGYAADSKKVLELIRIISDLEIAQPVPLQKSQYGRVKLLDPAAEGVSSEEAATRLSVTMADGKEETLWLGKVHETSEGRPNPFSGGMMMNDVGRYVKKGASEAVYIVNETFKNAETKASEWLDNSFFEVTKIKSISRKTAKPEEDWSLSREVVTGEFVLADAKADEAVDDTKVSSMKSAFSSPQFEDIMVGEAAKEPTASVFTIKTFDGFVYEIAAGEKNDLNELALTVKVSAEFPQARKPGEEENDEEKKKADESFAKELEENKKKLAKEKKLEGKVFKVRSFVVDSISKTRAELLAEKKVEEPKVEAPKAVAPKADAPKAVAPKAVTPKAVAPKAEAPKAEAPKAEAPKAEAPKAEAPKAEAPKAEAPKAEAPKAEAPKAEAPKAEAPKAEAPKAEAPKAEAPKAEAPKAEAPKPN